MNFVGRLVLAGLRALGRLAPRRHRMAAALGAAFAAAVRMIDRVHRHAADVRRACPSSALRPALPIEMFMWSGFDTAPTVAMQRPCTQRTSPELSRRMHVAAVAADDTAHRCRPNARSGRPCRLHLDVVHDRADRHGAERHGVAGLHVDLVAGDHRVADGQPLRRQDVGELAVLVLDQRDEGGAVRIVFEPLDLRRHVELAALEVDHAVGAACGRRPASATVTRPVLLRPPSSAGPRSRP